MATFANIVINDGQATPVAHTFSVKTNDQRVSIYEDRSGGIAVGYGRIRITTSDSDVIRRVKANIAIPTLEAVSGANPAGFTPAAQVAYTTQFNGEFLIPQRATLQEKKNIFAYAKNALALALFGSLVQDGEEITG